MIGFAVKQVYVPREELSLDVIKQYKVVSTLLPGGSSHEPCLCLLLLAPSLGLVPLM